MDLVARLMPDDTPADLEEALRLGQRHLHALGITAWQDAIVEPHAEERAYVALALERRADRPRRRGLVVGPPPWRRADRGVRRATSRDGDRPLRADQRQADDGRGPRELHRARCSSHTWMARAGRPATAGCSRSMPRALKTGCRNSTPWGSSPTSTPSATGRCGRRSMPSRRPGGRTARRTPGRTSPTSRSSTPTTSRASANSAWSPTPSPVGRARGPDGRAHDPVPRPSGGAGSTRSDRCWRPARSSRWVPTGASRVRTRCGRWRSRSQRRSPARYRGDRDVFLPEERLDSIDALAAFTSGSA